jgi:hypothetical protein
VTAREKGLLGCSEAIELAEIVAGVFLCKKLE